MEEFFAKLLGTVTLRPYVFIPVVLFLFFAWREVGTRRTLLWLVVGYGIAFASEFSSVRTGFPYGWYYYVKAPTADKEFWITNVPFFDSLSYTFLSYWAMTAARTITGEPFFNQRRFPYRTWLLGSLLMMLADVVIDPMALRGERHFLGTIFGYPEWGPYFGIPLENFGGWLLVAFTIIGSMACLDRWLNQNFALREPRWGVFSPLLFISMILFCTGVTFYIGEYKLFACGLLIMTPFYLWILLRLRKRRPSITFGKQERIPIQALHG